MTHELILLSPYRYPAQHALTLGEEDMACWLHGYSALWHPALLWQAKGPPRLDGQYEHENPLPGVIYALPDSPPLYLPDDWHERLRQVGSVAFVGAVDRASTLHNLQSALVRESAPDLGWKGGIYFTEEQVAPFFGLGLGYLLHTALAEAMEHDNLLDHSGFWDDVQQAIAALAGLPYSSSNTPPTPTHPANFQPENDYQEIEPPTEAAEPANFEEFQSAPSSPQSASEGGEDGPSTEVDINLPGSSKTNHVIELPTDPIPALKSAAARLLTAREVLYPVTIHLLDLFLVDDKNLDQPWPASFEQNNPLNILASGQLLEKLAQAQPDRIKLLRERLDAQQAEVVGGPYLEREDPLLPIESQLWNLKKGLEVSKGLLGHDIRVFARKRFGFHPQLPLLLSAHGLTRCLFLTFDENSGLPNYSATTLAWPSPDGKQLDGFVRAPLPVDQVNTFFNLGHNWFKTTREDHTATLAFLHRDKPAQPWYRDLLQLASLSGVLGHWKTFSQFFNEVYAGEHVSTLGPDEFHYDYLSERTAAQLADPVSAFSKHVKLRRRVDTCWTLAALQRSLSAGQPILNIEEPLRRLEDRLEQSFPSPGIDPPEGAGNDRDQLAKLEKQIAGALADRLQSKSEANRPGYMILNPCSFTRRLALEMRGAERALPIDGPVKASQLDGDLLRVVVEVPPLGFAWIPREGAPGSTAPTARMRLAEAGSWTLRNEFFEVTLDPQTGGLKGIADHKTKLNRLAGRLLFGPGSWMKATEMKVTSTGPALGEIVVHGQLLGEHDQELSGFTIHYRAWLGRPVLDMRIDLEPKQPPAGYPWHAYFGARFAWRDERAVLLRSAFGAGYMTSHTRPQTPDYLELRQGRQGTVIFPGGLPFHQKQEGRMVDVILMPEGEKNQTFELTLALDRDQPMQTALGLATPPVIVPTAKGPPHIGASGWLFHLDTPNLLMTRLMPGAIDKRADVDKLPTDALIARFLECGDQSGQAEFRCVRNPKRAVTLNLEGQYLLENTVVGDAVLLEVTPNDMVQVQVEFS